MNGELDEASARDIDKHHKRGVGVRPFPHSPLSVTMVAVPFIGVKILVNIKMGVFLQRIQDPPLRTPGLHAQRLKKGRG